MPPARPAHPAPWFDDLANAAIALAEGDDGGVRAEDAISAAAAAAGEACLMAAGVFAPDACPFPPGQLVLSDAVNRLLTGDMTEWEALPEVSAFGLVRDLLPENHFPPAERPAIVPIFERFAAGAAAQLPGEVPLSLGEAHRPRQPAALSALLLRPKVAALWTQAAVTAGERHRGCVVAMLRVLWDTRDVIAPDVALTLALETLVGMAKLAPAGMQAAPATAQGGFSSLLRRLRNN
ncbi:MAG TPA: hypothetical protein VGM87_07225 [Roseomonas sp.]|jgi:hypothetical protein